MTTKELFLQLLRFRSITPDDDLAFDFIKQYMVGFKAIDVNINGIKNLILYKKFGDGEHLSFAGHIDVVPAGDGWESEAFSPLEKDGYIYARGAQDMKSGVCALLQACKEAKEFQGTLSILLTSDEEGDAEHGTIEMLRYLQKENFLPNFVVVAEPTCEEVFGDAIKVGRRGSINGVIELFGLQGHAAYPQKAVNTIHQIAPILDKIAKHFFDSGDEFFAPSQLVVTDIRSGLEVTNISPGYLKLMFNVRNSTKTKQADIKAYLDEVLAGLDFKVKLTQGSYPFLTSKTSKIVTCITKTIEKELGIIPKHSTAGGTSDARFMGEFGIDVVEFGTKNDTIHAPNERVKFSEVEGLKRVFSSLIETF